MIKAQIILLAIGVIVKLAGMRFQNQKLAGFDGRQSAEGFGLDPTLGAGRLRERPRVIDRSDGNIHYARRPSKR